jgi:hypothetical protein
MIKKYQFKFVFRVGNILCIIWVFLALASVCLAGNPSIINTTAHLNMTLSMSKVSGDNQTGCIWKRLNDPFVVKVTDLNGNGVVSIPVKFDTENSGGTLSQTSVMTDTNGEARTFLTFGDESGNYTVSARTDGVEVRSGSPQNFTANAIGDEWSPLGPEVTYEIPPPFKNSVETLISGLGADLDYEASFSFAMKTRDCCMDDGGISIIEDGAIQGDGTIKFKLKGDSSVPGLAPPPFNREFDFGVVIVEVDFEVGVFWDFEADLSGTGGKRYNACDDVDCYYGYVGLGGALGVGPKFEAIMCTESWWTSRECTGLSIRPLHVSAALRGSMGLNQTSCAEGFSATASILDITVKAEFNVWEGVGVTWSHTFPGFPVL